MMETEASLNIDPATLITVQHHVAPVLAALLVVLLNALWRWRWRDYLLPARLARSAAEGPAEVPAGDDRQGLTGLVAPSLVPPRVSIVVPCCNRAEALDRNLPELLSQSFADYEVVIVDEASTDDTRDVIAACAKRYPNLRHTFVPVTARYVDRRKLAITLGIRAARAPWVVLTTADSRPASADWLAAMARHFDDAHDFVIGYANYEDDGTPAARRAIYERLRRQLTDFRAAAAGRAIGGDIANMAVRKSWFISQKGYADSLTVACGEDDLLIDALATPGRTAIAVGAAATVHEALPPVAVIDSERRARYETRHRLSRRGRCFAVREAAAAWATWGFALAAVCYAGLRGLTLALAPTYHSVDLPADAVFVVTLAAAITLPTVFLHRTATALGERGFSFTLLAHYALAAPWRGALLRWRWRLSRRSYLRR